MKRSVPLTPEKNCRKIKVSALTENATTILALNDDCFLEVCQYLDLLDFCAVAEVCHRFRQNAKACFAHSKKKNLNVKNDIIKHKNHRYSFNQVISKISKILRNFGGFISKFEEKSMACAHHDFEDIGWSYRWKPEEKFIWRAIYVRSIIIELLVRKVAIAGNKRDRRKKYSHRSQNVQKIDRNYREPQQEDAFEDPIGRKILHQKSLE